MSFPRYPKYKDSGVDWLGEVPEHWVVGQSRRLFSLRKERMREGDEQLTASQKYGVIPQADFMTREDQRVMQVLKDADILKHVEPGDFVISMRSFEGGIEYCEYRGCVSSAYVALIPGPLVHHGFCKYLFKSTTYIQALQSTSNLVRDGQALRFQNFALVPLPVIPFDEQRAIAVFLDRETAKIDGLVAEQRRLIELLKEKRQAVISHAVIKGLNPDAPLKPSGITWLGDVPAHWLIIPLARATIDKCDGPFGSGLKSDHYVENGVRVIRLQNIRREGFDGTDAAYINETYYREELSGHDVQCGDILIAGLGDDRNTVGRACVAPFGIEPAMVKADCFRFRVDTTKAEPKFVATQLTAGSDHDAGILSSGSTRSRIPLSVMASRKLALPSIPEQRVIMTFLDQETTRVNTLIAEAERAIALLQERRTALISAAVTGKIDVRGEGSP